MRTLLSRVVGFLGGRRLDAQLDEEVQFHLEMLAQEYQRRGLSAEEARRAARKQFGGVVQMKEAYRERRGLPFVETLLQDARYGVRGLLRTPGFAAAALVTLALGIGANSAVFSVVNAVLLQPLPYPEPERLVQMHRSGGGLWAGQTGRRYLFFREHMRTVEALAAWRGTAFNMTAGDSAEHVLALAVSKEYFGVFKGVPLHGRVFDASDDVVNGPPVVVLSHRIWTRMFRADPGVIGRTIHLADRPHTVVGVMPEGFDRIRTEELYVPLQPGTTGPGGGSNYTVVGRLREEVTLAQVNAEAAALFEAYIATLPNSRFEAQFLPAFVPYAESLATPVRPALLMMLGAVGLLLLIACANTANLLLARAAGRGRELSVRAALGAPRGRIVRQLLTESVLLFVGGGTLGVLLAYLGVPALLALMPPAYALPQEVRVDAFVLLVTLAVSVATGILFGLAPAVTQSRRDIVGAFKDDGTRTTAGRRSAVLRGALVVGEVAVCTLLLVGAGLLMQTFLKLRAVELGFDPRNVVAAQMSLLGERYGTSSAANDYFSRGLDRLRAIPGVKSAAVVNGIPIERGLNLNFDRPETAAVENHLTDWRYASADYFETMGIQVVAGRPIGAADSAGAPRVAVVSQTFANTYYKGENPIGQRILLFQEDGPIEIVGVARDVREAGLRGGVPAVMYVPLAQAGDSAIRTAHMYFRVSWVVRADAVTPELTRRIREELRVADPLQPITTVRSLEEVRARAMATETFQMSLLVSLASIGLLLAAAGIYGLIAYSVGQRTREFGIRMALGATRGRVLVSVLRQGAALAAVGIVAGVAAAAGGTRALQSFVFEVSTLDISTFAGVAVILLAVAIVATMVPAWRATRLNPVTALRE